jgi:hypothetical protein
VRRKLAAAGIVASVLACQSAHANPALEKFMGLFEQYCTCAAYAPYEMLRKAPKQVRDTVYPADYNAEYQVVYFIAPTSPGPNSLCPLGLQFPQGANPMFPYIYPGDFVVNFLRWWPAVVKLVSAAAQASCWGEINKLS